jgi:RimJ/RimL family protein N-acetyltransferase
VRALVQETTLAAARRLHHNPSVGLPSYRLQLPKIGTNVIIRPLEERDVTEMYALESDSEVKRFIGGPVRKTSDQWIPGMRSILPTCGVLAVVAKAEACFAGFATICHYLRGTGLPTNRDQELTILVAKSFQGRGLGREVSDLLIPAVFSELNAERVLATIHPDNSASLRLIARLGFTPAGVVADSNSWQDGHHIFALCLPRSSIA